MSGGRLLQHDRPARLVTHPADPFVSQLVGVGERALRLLALTPARQLAVAGAVPGPALPANASLREALSELLWSGAEAVNVAGDDGPPASVTLGSILRHGRQAAP
jgi:osmoprotectant transport system ATP-binding protein